MAAINIHGVASVWVSDDVTVEVDTGQGSGENLWFGGEMPSGLSERLYTYSQGTGVYAATLADINGGTIGTWADLDNAHDGNETTYAKGTLAGAGFITIIAQEWDWSATGTATVYVQASVICVQTAPPGSRLDAAAITVYYSIDGGTEWIEFGTAKGFKRTWKTQLIPNLDLSMLRFRAVAIGPTDLGTFAWEARVYEVAFYSASGLAAPYVSFGTTWRPWSATALTRPSSSGRSPERRPRPAPTSSPAIASSRGSPSVPPGP